jgi:hypothetical protein
VELEEVDDELEELDEPLDEPPTVPLTAVTVPAKGALRTVPSSCRRAAL